MDYSLNRNQISKIDENIVNSELKRVAEYYNFRRFTRREFDAIARDCKGTTVLNRYKTWDKALESIGVSLKPLPKRERIRITNEDLFVEMDRVWKLLGHRPSSNEWVASQPKYSYTTYKTRFKGWINACSEFINWLSSNNPNYIKPLQGSDITNTKDSTPIEIEKIKDEDKRNIPLKLRLQVLDRDNFKCVYCGRSPATHLGVNLHIDHIKPFSDGGKTELGNLQTLCQDCNWGKGDSKSFS